MMICAESSSNPIMNELANGSRRHSEEEQIIMPLKQPRFYYKSFNETIRTSEEDTESVTSIQNYDTELVEDTPDTETRSESDSSDEVEYEVGSLSESESNPIINNDSSSDCEDMLSAAGAIAAVICDTSREAWLTDGEDSDNSSAGETALKRKDFWTCIQCKSKNNNPLFRYCQKCFQVRKNFFPPRPRGQKKKNINTPSSVQSNSATSSHDSGFGSSQDILPIKLNLAGGIKENIDNISSQGTKRKSTSSISEDEIKNKKSKLSEEINVASSSKEEIISNVSSQGTKRKNSTNISEEETKTLVEDEIKESFPTCIICNVQKRDSIFLHGNIGHMHCCYKCAKRCWNTTKRCPTCNRKIQQVVKVFS